MTGQSDSDADSKLVYQVTDSGPIDGDRTLTRRIVMQLTEPDGKVRLFDYERSPGSLRLDSPLVAYWNDHFVQAAFLAFYKELAAANHVPFITSSESQEGI